jgi:hypothetical protein
VYNLLDLERFRWEGGIGGLVHEDWFGKAPKPGQHTIVFDFKYDGVLARARAAPACSPWMAKNWTRRPSSTRFLC